MQRFSLPASALLLAFASVALAVPDESGNLVTPGEAEAAVSGDGAMASRLNYNVGFERFEQARRLEMEGGSLKGAAAKQNETEVLQGMREAREKFRAATVANAAMKEAWNMVGYTSRRLGDYQESLAAYDKALALAPDYPEAVEYRAELFVLTGKFEEAKAAHAQLQKSSPSYADVLKQSMRDWAKRKDAPGSDAPGRDAFVAWVGKL
jgi:tetratricopeptide (TPR) repeat protein